MATDVRKTKKKIERREIPAKDLVVHPEAQRRLVVANVKRIFNEFSFELLGALAGVHYAPGPVQIVDGQSRLHATMEHGFGEWGMQVDVHLYVRDDAGAAKLFLGLQNRSVLAAFDKFTNEITAGEPWAVGASGIAHKFQIGIKRGTADGSTCAVASLKTAYQVDSGKTLAATLGVITEAWGTKAAAMEGRIIDGISLLVGKYNGKIELPSLVSVLAKYSGGPARLIGTARGIRDLNRISMKRAVAHAAIVAYNQHRRVGKLDPL